MPYHGHDSYVQFGKESAYGTKATTIDNWIGIVQSFSPEETNNIETQYGLGSRNFIQSKIGSKGFSGSVEFLVQNFKMFEFALGNVSYGATAVDGVYPHVVTEANDLPSFSFQAGLLGGTNFVRDYTGCKVDTLTISAEKEEALTAEIEFIAQDMTDGTAGTAPLADTSSYFSFYEGSVTVNGVEQALVEEFELEISNGLEGLFAIGSNKIVRLQEGQREYALSMGFVFEDTAQFELWKSGAEFDTTLKFVAPDKRELEIVITGCKYDSNELELGAEDYLVQSLEAVAKSVTVNVKTPSATEL
jgi:hypothetical protein